MGEGVGQGGFFFPRIYGESKPKVTECLRQGDVDLVESSRWSLADEFLAFILKVDFLPFADRTYPNPRRKNEIPVWFVITCQFVMRIHLEKAYSALSTLLKSGPVLSRVGFNVRAELGFNDKNRYERQTPVHQDAVRKFFKDTDSRAMRRWFNIDLQRWFRRMGCFDYAEGVYILDQTHMVVPRNSNYEDAVYMPVDEHGQRYAGFDDMTEEERRALPRHPCYTLSTLLHLSFRKNAFHVAAYEFGPGNEDELPQAGRLIETFFQNNRKGSMRLLVADRGYLSGEFITSLKQHYDVDTLIPLRKNMAQHQDAIAISEMPDTQWETVSECGDEEDYRIVRACTIDDICLWDMCKAPLHTTVVEIEKTTGDDGGVQTNRFCLASTRKFDSPHAVVNSYRLRPRTEECFRQLKHAWKIDNFPSPDRSLLEAHIGFTLTTYSLLQLYLMRSDLQARAYKMISSLKREEHASDQNLLVYANDHFARFSLKEFLGLTYHLSREVQEKLADTLATAIHQR